MKRLICLLLVLTTLVSLTACGGNPPDGPGGPDNPGTPGTPVIIENADLLAYSFNRIENADLSFNMSMNSQTSLYNTSSAGSSVTACGSSSTVVFENPDELAWVDFFENEESSLVNVRDQARRLCDYVLEKVTVVNKIVYNSGSSYLLSYEGEGDVLTVYCFTGGVNGDLLEKAEDESTGEAGEKRPIKDGGGYVDPLEAAFAGKVTNLARIQFSFDEDGDETVSWFSYDIGYDDYSGAFTVNSMEVVYTPGKHYEIKNYTCQLDKTTLEKKAGTDFMNVTVADHSTGKWQGITWYGSGENPLFTKTGEYDYNNNVSIGFVFETDEGFMQFNGKLEAYRDGYMINSGEALESDEIRLVVNQQVSELFWMNIGEGSFIFSLALANIDGWDRVVLDPSDEEDPYHCYLRANDYVEFSNGKRLYGSEFNSTVWIDGVGFVFIRYAADGSDEYVDENGEAHNSEWFVSVGGEDYSRRIQFGGESYLNPQTNTASNFFLDAQIITHIDNPLNSDIPVCTDPIGLMESFFAEMGLSSKLQPDLDKTFAAIKSVYDNRTQYMDALFLDWNGVTFNYDTFVEYIFDSFLERSSTLSSYNGFGTRYEAVDISMIPEMPEDFALIAISGGVTGSVTVSGETLDFSAVSVAVTKNILLGDQNEYGVAAVLLGKKACELTGAFEVKAYANADMSVSGKAGIALPTELAEGEYTLSLYFGRKTEGGFARLSEVVVPTVSSFTPFSKRIDVADGYYTYEYSVVNGTLCVSVTFTDTKAPDVIVANAEIVSDKRTVSLPAGSLVSDLLACVTATDNRDGLLVITSDNLLLMDTENGSRVSAADALADGATYRITVSDSSGNESFVNIAVNIE